MDYKVIITPRKLCDAGMAALAAQANYEVVDKVNACNFCRSFKKADALMIKEGWDRTQGICLPVRLKGHCKARRRLRHGGCKGGGRTGHPCCHYAGCKRAFRCRAHRRQ